MSKRTIRRSFSEQELQTIVDVLYDQRDQLAMHQAENDGQGNGYHDPDQLAACEALLRRLTEGGAK